VDFSTCQAVGGHRQECGGNPANPALERIPRGEGEGEGEQQRQQYADVTAPEVKLSRHPARAQLAVPHPRANHG